MAATKHDQTMNMPELLVFARLFVIGFVGAEVWRIAYYLGSSFALTLSGVPFCVIKGGVILELLICFLYARERELHIATEKIGRSFRFDLLGAIVAGIWVNALTSPWLSKVHDALKDAEPQWAPAILLYLSILLTSPLFRKYCLGTKKAAPQLYFLADEEVVNDKDDLLASDKQVKSFADTVLESEAHSGLTFGVDGPWGVGKTSFINLAQHYWEAADDRVIVCRFEPLRYASDPDLSDRLIRDLSSAIQQKVFVPEFRPAVSRYSRLIKGKADISFLGFKLTLEPSQETADELLDDINDVLKRINRRVIIVIDDLDRLDTKTINNVLFAIRRTFKLSQATYILCYDTEVLAGGHEENSRAREFLEKFITVKLSLFVDSSHIRDFLRRDWKSQANQLSTTPSDTMQKLSSVLDELANILDGDKAAQYLPLAGDLRKVKRFVNAMLLMQLEKSDLGRTDFNERDLINLILIHLNYPGLFRRIYAEETQGRSGIFSVRREYGQNDYKNASDFSVFVEAQPETPAFLLKELFDTKTLDLKRGGIDEEKLSSRACFNQTSARNLENYLKLIVRFITPEPQETFVLYKKAVEQVLKGASIESVLSSHDFRLERGDHAHDQFWRILANQAHSFTREITDNAIDTLVEYLPRYSSIVINDRGLRERSIYTLLQLLDSAGWGDAQNHRYRRKITDTNVMEIAWRIFGEHSYKGKGLLQRLVASSRGVIGWSDLMTFRLSCSIDRQSQLHNLYTALIRHNNSNAPIEGDVKKLELAEMREISQRIFFLFKREYITPRRNFYKEISETPDTVFLGDAPPPISSPSPRNGQPEQNSFSLEKYISSARSTVAIFVIYQLSSAKPPSGSGVCCGFYDESGTADKGGIAKLMNKYIFRFCFEPSIDENNIFYFLDYCLEHLGNAFSAGEVNDGYYPTKSGLPGGLDPKEMGLYWERNGQLIKDKNLQKEYRSIVTYNYIATYREDLDGVFKVLDELASDVASGSKEAE
ncbi:KAP P-loop protein [Hahella sp. KA22]|uniref:KAP family NTPase n=1 Tax=Hahella sp. KA22 TaxID=1628392 RepID=UPI000FDEDA9C|nr:KAP family NTPase [Hahella sp. KA22]AZZ92308.1 KAP P-loop protein [Hahella sp. KA22]QAY55680.1 KAP P-loop protein [Hahella sp. KA22]